MLNVIATRFIIAFAIFKEYLLYIVTICSWIFVNGMIMYVRCIGMFNFIANRLIVAIRISSILEMVYLVSIKKIVCNICISKSFIVVDFFGLVAVIVFAKVVVATVPVVFGVVCSVGVVVIEVGVTSPVCVVAVVGVVIDTFGIFIDGAVVYVIDVAVVFNVIGTVFVAVGIGIVVVFVVFDVQVRSRQLQAVSFNYCSVSTRRVTILIFVVRYNDYWVILIGRHNLRYHLIG